VISKTVPRGDRPVDRELLPYQQLGIVAAFGGPDFYDYCLHVDSPLLNGGRCVLCSNEG